MENLTCRKCNSEKIAVIVEHGRNKIICAECGTYIKFMKKSEYELAVANNMFESIVINGKLIYSKEKVEDNTVEDKTIYAQLTKFLSLKDNISVEYVEINETNEIGACTIIDNKTGELINYSWSKESGWK